MPKKFSKEYKLEAIRMVQGGRKVTDVANSLGIDPSPLYRWIRAFNTDTDGSFPGKGHLKPAEEELRKVKRERDAAIEERDILKKALAIFSQHRD